MQTHQQLNEENTREQQHQLWQVHSFAHFDSHRSLGRVDTNDLHTK